MRVVVEGVKSCGTVGCDVFDNVKPALCPNCGTNLNGGRCDGRCDDRCDGRDLRARSGATICVCYRHL